MTSIISFRNSSNHLSTMNKHSLLQHLDDISSSVESRSENHNSDICLNILEIKFDFKFKLSLIKMDIELISSISLDIHCPSNNVCHNEPIFIDYIVLIVSPMEPFHLLQLLHDIIDCGCSLLITIWVLLKLLIWIHGRRKLVVNSATHSSGILLIIISIMFLVEYGKTQYTSVGAILHYTVKYVI